MAEPHELKSKARLVNILEGIIGNLITEKILLPLLGGGGISVLLAIIGQLLSKTISIPIFWLILLIGLALTFLVTMIIALRRPTIPRDTSIIPTYREQGGDAIFLYDASGQPKGFQEEATYHYFNQALGLPTDIPTKHLPKSLIAIEQVAAYASRHRPRTEDIYIQLPKSDTPYPSDFAPQGKLWLGDTSFELRSEWDFEAGKYMLMGLQLHPDPSNAPDTVSIPVKLDDITSVFFLLVAGCGHIQIQNIRFEGRQIGFTELCLDVDVPLQRQPLILGRHIREWNCYNPNKNLVKTISDNATRQVWLSRDKQSVLDMLRIDIRDAPRYLDSVRITAEYDPPVQLSTPYTPRISVFAITCQKIKDKSSY
jgi:hypothetical protein